MIEAGTYRARARGEQYVAFGVSSNGNEQVAVELELLGDGDAPSGESITWTGTFASETAIRIALDAMRAMGWTGSTILDLTGIGSTVVEAVVEHETYQGETRARVRFINVPGASRFKFKQELDAGGKAALAARLRAYTAKPGAQAAPARPAARPAPAPRPAPQRAPAPAQWDGQGADPADDSPPF